MLKKRLSQHLLKDKNILRKIVRTASVNKDDVVIEIGAGHGDLTRILAEAAAYVNAVEVDRECAEFLEPLVKETGNVEVTYGDILTMPLNRFSGEGKAKIVANIPYKITGPIVFKILEERSVIHSAHLTVQKEIGERMASKPFCRTYGAMSVNCQLFSRVKMQFIIKPHLFIPPPKVDSAFVSMTFEEEDRGLPDDLMGFVRTCFFNKRKHLKYTLKKHHGDDFTEALYKAFGFAGTIRAEELEPRVFRDMYWFLAEAHGTQEPQGSGVLQ